MEHIKRSKIVELQNNKVFNEAKVELVVFKHIQQQTVE
jgi:hypothetical protein